MVQAVEHLPTKCEALSSNHSTENKNKNKNKNPPPTKKNSQRQAGILLFQ
jgi:hypothetical protein